MSAALVTVIALLGGLVGFAVGWVAKRDFAEARIKVNTAYWQAQLAALESQLLEQNLEQAHPVAPATTVVQHFHMHAPSWPAQPARVIDAEVLRALPGEVA